MRQTTRLLLGTAFVFALFGATGFALFTNGGFETGDTTGWTESSFRNFGLSGNQPFSGTSIVRTSGGADRTTAVGPAAAPMSLSDPLVPAVQYPRFGAYAARVNYWATGAGDPARNANSILQQSVVTADDVDASDGLVHARFAYLPVLEDGGHVAAEQSFFYVVVRNVTKSTVVWQRFAFANEAGVPWQSSGAYRYTGWQAVDVPGGAGVIDVGDTLELEVVAAACALGGHRGHVYVDSFGSEIPGGSVVATAPPSTTPNAALTYAIHVANGGTAALDDAVVTIAVPAQTSFASVSNPLCTHAGGTVTCNLGTLAAGATVDFSLVVTVANGASGTITLGNYSIAGTGYPALLGPARTTVVNAPVANPDSYTATEDTALTIANASGVLANDTDPNGDGLRAILVTAPQHGTVALNNNGGFTYTPAANYSGPDSFIYRASDGNGNGNGNSSQNANVTLTVTPVPDPPLAVADSYTGAEDTALSVSGPGVLANDTDPDAGTTLTAAVVANPANGSLALAADGSFVYTPLPDFAGADSFTYRANDGSANSNTVTVTLTIAPGNDPPVGTADAYTTAEDTSLVVPAAGVLANDSDSDPGTTLQVALIVSGPSNGTLQVDPNGGFTYTPNANFSGADGFVYRATDGAAMSGDTLVTLTVSGVNDAPTGVADAYTTGEDAAASGNVLANDTDPEGAALQIESVVTNPANGTLTLDPNGSFTYTPNADYNGPDSFVYRATDGGASTGDVTVSLTVTPVNDAPVGADDSYTTAEDTALTAAALTGVLANDTDADTGTTLQIAAIVTGPSHGVLAMNPDGSFTYTPNADYNGADSFVYRATDGAAETANVTVTLSVTSVNDAPTAVADSYATDEDTPLTVAAAGVLGNDTDPDAGATLTAVVVSGPAHGTLSPNPDGSFTYTPNADYAGPDSFTYAANDGVAQSAPVTVSLSVTSVNDVPTAVADSYTTSEDAALTIAATGVLGNDTDADAGAALAAVLVANPANGTLTLNPDGSFTYTPNADYTGADSFTYAASDGTAQSAPVTVSLSVSSVNDAPTAVADAYTTDEDTALTIAAAGVLANDTDADAGSTLTAVVVTNPAHGTLTLDGNGSFVYTPTANWHGSDSFTYRASDGTADSAPVTVTLTVSPVADAPTGTSDGTGGTYTTSEDGTLTVPAPGVLANDVDPDGDPLTAILVTPPAHGTVTLNPDGSFVYTPNPNYSGPDSFTYRASDGTSQSGDTTVLIVVAPHDDAPTAGNDGTGGTFTATEDGSLNVPAPGVLANDSDPDGDPLTAILVTPPAHGTVTLNPDGSFVYTPNANYAGPDSFTYVVSDGDQTSQPATVTLVVTPVNDAPTAAPNSYTFTEDRTLVVPAAIGLLANDDDVDDVALTAVLVTPPAHGTLTLNPDGSFTFVPEPGYSGTDTFTYHVTDGTSASTPVTVTLTIAEDTTVTPGAGRDTGGTRVFIEGPGFGPAGTPVTVTIGGVPATEAEVLPDGRITFVTPALPGGTPVDIVFVVNGGSPETLPGAFLPMPAPAPGSPADTDGDGLTDETELRYGLDPTDPEDAGDDPDADGVPTSQEVPNGTHPNAPYIRYFAEGVNNALFNTGIAIANSSTATMEVQLTFFRQGAAPIRKNITLSGRTRTLLDSATVPGLAEASFGVEIAGNEAVAADRTTQWNVGGGRGAHSEHAVEASRTWYFAEGATTGRFSLFYLLTNPSDQPVNATVTFLRQVGGPIAKDVVVPPYARYTIYVNAVDEALRAADMGGKVEADRPIVVERSMYLNSETKLWEAGSGGTGVTAPATKWFFGEGAAGNFFDAWILLSNPGTEDATVSIRYVADNGADVTRAHLVRAGQRTTVRVVDEDPSMMNTSFATFVTSTNGVPVVAERAMWWRANEGGWTSGHVGTGFTEGGTRWVTADGVASTDGNADTYALVSNTEARAGLLQVTALFDDGTAPVVKLYPIGPNQRFTVHARGRFPEVVGKGFSFLIESIGAAPVDIVVDHSTYWNIDGRFWEAGSTAPGSRIK